MFHLCAKNYQSSWKFDDVLTKTIVHSFFFGGGDAVYKSVAAVNLRQLRRQSVTGGWTKRLSAAAAAAAAAAVRGMIAAQCCV